MAIKGNEKVATKATVQPEVNEAPKGEALAVNEQTAQSTQLSVQASGAAGSQLAVTEAKAFVVNYAKTSQDIASTIETELNKIRESRHAAIASVPVEATDSDFLAGFKSDLQSLLSPTNSEA